MSEFSWTCCSRASFQESQEAECKCQAFLLAGGEKLEMCRCEWGAEASRHCERKIKINPPPRKKKKKKRLLSLLLVARNILSWLSSQKVSVWQDCGLTTSWVRIIARISFDFLHCGWNETLSFSFTPTPDQTHHPTDCMLKIHFKFSSPSHGACPPPPPPLLPLHLPALLNAKK